jgi:transposase
LKKFATELAASAGWRKLRDGVEVKLTRCLETHDTIILCRSAERRAKERAMHEKFSGRIELSLARLAARIERSRVALNPHIINRQIGRILQANQRAAARFDVRLINSGSPAGFHLNVEHNAAFDEWAALSEGAYVLRSNITDWSDEQLWKAYIQLSQAEAAFRIHKDQLRVRPIWHQRADRVQAHILVCFLAFVLWKTLELWQQKSGLGNSPRTVLEELARIQSHDVILPTPTHGDIKLRCVTYPDPAQSALLERLGIVLPKRMRLAETDTPDVAISA